MLRMLALSMLLSLSICAAAAEADSVAEGYSAYRRGDYGKAFELWSKAAEEGNAVAMNNLGVLYLEGQGVTQDAAAGLSWIRKSADRGYSGAQYNLGQHYKRGDGTPLDPRGAVLLFGLAGSQGHAQALHEVGVAFRDGAGVPRSAAQAYKWLDLAAREGDAEAAADRDAVKRMLSPDALSDVQSALVAREKGPEECKREGRAPTTAWSAPVIMRGFMTDTPMGGGWCVIGMNFFRSNVAFGESVIEGKTNQLPDNTWRHHTIIALAERYDVEGPLPRNAAELKTLTETWTSLAFPTLTQISGKTRIRLSRSPVPEDQRFSALSWTVEPEELNGMECARYVGHTRETGNKLFPGKTLEMHTKGYLCLDPNSGTDLIGNGVSERFIEGQREFRSILDPDQIEYEIFLHSLSRLGPK